MPCLVQSAFEHVLTACAAVTGFLQVEDLVAEGSEEVGRQVEALIFEVHVQAELQCRIGIADINLVLVGELAVVQLSVSDCPDCVII